MTRGQRQHLMKSSSERGFDIHGSSHEDEEEFLDDDDRPTASRSQTQFRTFPNSKPKSRVLQVHASTTADDEKQQLFMLKQMEMILHF